MQKYNLKDLQECYYGETEIERIMYGERLVWEGNKIIYLGNAQSFNVANVYDGYADLTADNFLFLSAGSCSGSDTKTVSYDHDNKYVTIYSGMSKSYTPSTGVLSFYSGCGSTRGNTRVVLVKNLSKLVDMGSGTTFNVKNYFPNDYQNMTVDCFAGRIIKHWNSTNSDNSWNFTCRIGCYYTGTYSATSTWTMVKSYNASTGVLTFHANDTGSGVNQSWDRDSTTIHVYARKKPFV